MKKLLEELSKEKLIEFIEEYAKKDNNFRNAVNVHFGKPEYEEELLKINNAIDNALCRVSDYSCRDSWGNAVFNTGHIITEIRQRIGQGHVRLAFAEIEMLYRKLLENLEYQGECEIIEEAEYCIDIMSEIADLTSSSGDKEFIFSHIIALSELEDGKNYGADYEDKLLKIAAKFVTAENRAKLEKALAPFESTRREEAFKLIQLEIIRKIDGEDAVDAFITENLQFPKIREIARRTKGTGLLK